MRQKIKKWNMQSGFKRCMDIIAFLIMAAGAGISIYMNTVGRSLWVDEAMLAYSFSERSVFSLTSAPFEWLQSAPVLYLYLAKILTLIFGNTEFVLRSFSVVCYMLVLFLTWYLAKKLFHVRYAPLCAAFVANMNFMLKYSNVFKQYMSECIWVLLVLLIYYLYKERNLSLPTMTVCYMAFLWGANPACFFIGGVLACEFLTGVMKKDRLVIKNSLITGAGVFVSFVVYYFYWLKSVAASDEMQNYWAGAVFPLIPRSIADLKEAQALIYDIFITFREGRIFILGLVLAAFLIGFFKEKNRYVMVTALGFFLSLFASFLKMFPVADRMWCFSYPIFAVLAFMAIDRMIPGERTAGELAAAFLMLVLILTNNGILVYRHAENVFWSGEEANAPIAYVQEHIGESEKAYVYYHSIPVVKYKIGYDTNHIGAGEGDNIVWSSGTCNDSEVLEQDVAKIEASGKCYLIASHTTDDRFGPLLNRLSQDGNLEVLQNIHETPLYYFTMNKKDEKTGVSYELIDKEEEGDTCYVTIRVTNTGESFLNTDFDDVVLGCRDRDDIGTNLWGNLAPGEYFDMPLSFDWKGDTSVKLQLQNGEKYWYEDLGFTPITVTKGE